MTDKHLTYDDVLIEPQHSTVDSRSNVSLQHEISPHITLDVPVIASPMDTVCEAEMANAMKKAGAIGFVHRFMKVNDYISELYSIDGPTVGVVGIDNGYRIHECVETGVDAICVDVAHGHMQRTLDVVCDVRSFFNGDIIVGSIATSQAAEDLFDAGADAVKVGVGPGQVCTTREKTGVGVPQISAIKSVNAVASSGEYVLADGGMQTPGDCAKAFAAGADGVVLGSYFGSCVESPNPGKVRGMASESAQDESNKSKYIEGGEKSIEHSDTAAERVESIVNGVRSACSYAGYHNLSNFIGNARLVEVSSNASRRSGMY